VRRGTAKGRLGARACATGFARYTERFSLRPEKWARQDSNLGPRDYESPALTAELQAHLNYRVKHNTSLVTNPESIRDCSNSEFLASKPLSYRPTAPLRGERLTFSKDRLCL
jgi:hypothetical protein